jgi:nucleoside-diphosphate-sugar epimerase
MARLLLTGSAGLIGRALRRVLCDAGHDVVGFDSAVSPCHPDYGDVRSPAAVAARAAGCDGIVHLAAIARVGMSAADPRLCRSVNVGGTRTVLEAARCRPERPFVLLASSREVYGEPAQLPVVETAPMAPINVYGRSKAAAELLVEHASRSGLVTQIVRYANVYGCIDDHPDRVVPAFTRAAALGGLMHVRGAENAFDFTHVDDVARGTARLIEALLAGERQLPPIQFATGEPTTLAALARHAHRLGSGRARLIEEPTVGGTVARFWGNPARARQLLGWEPGVTLETGLRAMIGGFAKADARTARPMVA